MVFEALIPGMEDGQKPQPDTEPLGIGGQLHQRLGRGTEQDAIDHTRVLQGQRRQFMGEGENDVAIRNRQHLLGSGGQPLIARSAVALGTMPVAARSILGELMRAMIALQHVRAERGSAACADVAESLPLFTG